ncbi:MAG: hypothetical protein JO316_20920 [Abitibacteriaceae bacterium]|nr:hypothetical protein [Abditibacteriaceae bacterium]
MKRILFVFGLSITFWGLWQKGLVHKPTKENRISVFNQSAQTADLITLSPPINGIVLGERGQLQVIHSRSGRMAHAIVVRPKKSNCLSYLALHIVEPTTVSTLTYQVNEPVNPGPEIDAQGARIAFDPQFSPDGRYVLFKYGEPISEDGTYRLYVLDIITNSLSLASDKYLTYRVVSWAPDSNYIAFVEGGDADGRDFFHDLYNGPLHLYVCNWRTGEAHLAVSNDILKAPFSWLAPHTLLYGILSEQGQKIVVERLKAMMEGTNQKQQSHANRQAQVNAAKANVVQPEPRPNLYAYSFENQTSKLLFKDGYLPAPAPDGQHLAFFGSEHPEKPYPLRYGWEESPQGASLAVARLDGSQRIALNVEGDDYPSIFWLPDNQHFLTFEQMKPSPNAQAEVRNWDVKTRHFKRLALLQAKDYTQAPRRGVEPQFSPRRLSSNSDTLFVCVTEFTGRNPGSAFVNETSSLEAVEVNTGKVTIIAQAKDDDGVDWYDELPDSHNPDNSEQSQK